MLYDLWSSYLNLKTFPKTGNSNLLNIQFFQSSWNLKRSQLKLLSSLFLIELIFFVVLCFEKYIKNILFRNCIKRILFAKFQWNQIGTISLERDITFNHLWLNYTFIGSITFYYWYCFDTNGPLWKFESGFYISFFICTYKRPEIINFLKIKNYLMFFYSILNIILNTSIKNSIIIISKNNSYTITR